MAMAVQTNMGAVTALKHLNTNQNMMNGQLERLSSGYRINSAADDAAGYAISSKMEGTKGKLVAAQENAMSA
ncbi:MAG: flagellar protein, partial [Zetaproteobacteria bacterium]|nr:flagellar protein [Zetaproteobacteria bacterium]